MGQLIDRETFERGVRANRYVIEPGQVLSPGALEFARDRGVEISRQGSKLENMPRQGLAIEELSARITERFVASGVQPGPELIEAVAAEVEAIARGDKDPGELVHDDEPQMLNCLNCGAAREGAGRQRVVVTSSGRNTCGIVAGLAAVLAETRADILDLSQTLVGDYFTMIMVIDIAGAAHTFEIIRERLQNKAEQLGVHVTIMHDDLLQSMHRV